MLAILAMAVYVASRTIRTAVAIVVVIVKLSVVVELISSLDSRIVRQIFPSLPGKVNVVVKVLIRALEHVQILSLSSRLVLS